MNMIQICSIFVVVVFWLWHFSVYYQVRKETSQKVVRDKQEFFRSEKKLLLYMTIVTIVVGYVSTISPKIGVIVALAVILAIAHCFFWLWESNIDIDLAVEDVS